MKLKKGKIEGEKREEKKIRITGDKVSSKVKKKESLTYVKLRLLEDILGKCGKMSEM